MWLLNEMKRVDTTKGRFNQCRRKKKAFRKRNFWCSIYKRKDYIFLFPIHTGHKAMNQGPV